MVRNILASLMALALALGVCVPRASAEGTNATCEVEKNGEKNKKASGPCTVSEAGGEVKISLQSGNSFTLKPAKKENHFKDQKGNRVGRTTSGDQRVYKWDAGRTITIKAAAKAAAKAATPAAEKK